jgi:hypothetical protein
VPSRQSEDKNQTGRDGHVGIFIHCEILPKRERRADETVVDRETL